MSRFEFVIGMRLRWTRSAKQGTTGDNRVRPLHFANK